MPQRVKTDLLEWNFDLQKKSDLSLLSAGKLYLVNQMHAALLHALRTSCVAYAFLLLIADPSPEHKIVFLYFGFLTFDRSMDFLLKIEFRLLSTTNPGDSFRLFSVASSEIRFSF